MNPHILIVEDIEDIFEHVKYKLTNTYPDFKITVSDNCDTALFEIERHLTNQRVTLLILDLSFNHIQPSVKLRSGNDLLRKLRDLQIEIPTIIYSVFSEMKHIQPVISNYNPDGYIIKSNTSTNELLVAVNRLLHDKTYYSPEVQKEQLKRYSYSHQLDDVDLQIIKKLPDISFQDEWTDIIFSKGSPLSKRTIFTRLKRLKEVFEVDNEKQLVLKLYKLALIQ